MRSNSYYRTDLEDFKSYPESKSCYLDGRYFNIVFKNFPGLLSNPLFININNNKVDSYMSNTLHNNEINIARCIVTVNNLNHNIRHSVLIIINHIEKIILIYDPDANHPELHQIIMNTIIDYFDEFNYDFVDVEAVEPPMTYLPNCDEQGVCNALVILYAYRYLMNQEMTIDDVMNVRRFMSAVQSNYILPKGEPDVEYLTNQDLLLTGTGALSGGLIGSAVGGPGGAIAGAALGGVGGYLISNSIENNRDRRYHRHPYHHDHHRY